MLVLVRFIAFPNDSRLITPRSKVPVKAIGGSIQCAVSKPFDMKILGVIGHIADLAVGLYPVDALAMLGPKRFRIAK